MQSYLLRQFRHYFMNTWKSIYFCYTRILEMCRVIKQMDALHFQSFCKQEDRYFSYFQDEDEGNQLLNVPQILKKKMDNSHLCYPSDSQELK